MTRKKRSKAQAGAAARRDSKGPPETKRSSEVPRENVVPPNENVVPRASTRSRPPRPPKAAKSQPPSGEGARLTRNATPPPPPPPPPLGTTADLERAAESSVPPPPDEAPVEEPSTEDIIEEIRTLEARLDQMIDHAAQHHPPTADVPPTPPPPTYPPPPSARPASSEPDTVFDTARELLSTDFYLRKWGRLGMRNRSEEVDDFGFDPIYETKIRPFLNFLYERYFRVDCEGIAHVPAEGRCLLVANHSGTLPFDGVMIKTAVKREHSAHRDVRWLAEDFIFHFPFIGAFSNRIGAVRACQENAERLLRHEALVTVFPEGVKGIGKLYAERYRLQRFGRGGFIKLCLRTGTPIVPVAVVGGEETNPMLARVEYFAKALGLPYIPITPTFPALGPLGLAPAPTKWRIQFGEVISFEGHGPEAADDEILVGRLAERVRATIQGMLDRAVGARRSVWFG